MELPEGDNKKLISLDKFNSICYFKLYFERGLNEKERKRITKRKGK